MGIEIERKFLVRATDGWRSAGGQQMVQGYLARGDATVRIRIAGDVATLTIKGPTTGLSRLEFEYSIPSADADELLRLCGGRLVRKTRYRVPYGGHVWEVDEFLDDNAGLVLAEVEMISEDETPEPPPWLGREVSSDPRFRNAALAERPWRTWPAEERQDS